MCGTQTRSYPHPYSSFIGFPVTLFSPGNLTHHPRLAWQPDCRECSSGTTSLNFSYILMLTGTKPSPIGVCTLSNKCCLKTKDSLGKKFSSPSLILLLKDKPTATMPSRLRQRWCLGKKSCSRPLVRTSMGAPMPKCVCWMEPTSIIRWSKMAGAGGIGNMRREIPCLKGWRREHGRRRMACGLIQHLFRLGSIAKRAVEGHPEQ